MKRTSERKKERKDEKKYKINGNNAINQRLPVLEVRVYILYYMGDERTTPRAK